MKISKPFRVNKKDTINWKTDGSAPKWKANGSTPKCGLPKNGLHNEYNKSKSENHKEWKTQCQNQEEQGPVRVKVFLVALMGTFFYCLIKIFYLFGSYY